MRWANLTNREKNVKMAHSRPPNKVRYRTVYLRHLGSAELILCWNVGKIIRQAKPNQQILMSQKSYEGKKKKTRISRPVP